MYLTPVSLHRGKHRGFQSGSEVSQELLDYDSLTDKEPRSKPYSTRALQQVLSLSPMNDGNYQVLQHHMPAQGLSSQHPGLDPQYFEQSQFGDSIISKQSPHPVNPMPQLQPYQRSRGYGRISFKRKPDSLGDWSTWSPEERQCNRRIVSFTKTIFGDIFELDCEAIAPDCWHENALSISCIRWAPSPPGEIQHRLAGQCLFTSVDIILLLEKLIGNAFTLQEKNRIRRNLEGYRPETIKKEGSTGLFFQQVMAYSEPKTHNIIKDIKVFLWSDLPKALRKVVQKYSLNGDIPIGMSMTPGMYSERTV
jgi:hypothetical protein